MDQSGPSQDGGDEVSRRQPNVVDQSTQSTDQVFLNDVAVQHDGGPQGLDNLSLESNSDSSHLPETPDDAIATHEVPEKSEEKAGPSTDFIPSNYLPWPDYFMSLCYLTAARSKDPNTKVGACIVDKENRVVSLGYNGMPRGIKDDDLPWGKKGAHSYETKYPYVCHAEMNAIVNDRHTSLDNCSIYVSKFPCAECAKLIIQVGIKTVVFAELKPEPVEEQVPSKTMFKLAGVTCKKFIPSIRQLDLNVIGGEGRVIIMK